MKVAWLFLALCIPTASLANSQDIAMKKALCLRSGTPSEASAAFASSIHFGNAISLKDVPRDISERLVTQLREKCTKTENPYLIADELVRDCISFCAPKNRDEDMCSLYCRIYDSLNRAYINGAASAAKDAEGLKRELASCNARSSSQPGANNKLIKQLDDLKQAVPEGEGRSGKPASATQPR